MEKEIKYDYQAKFIVDTNNYKFAFIKHSLRLFGITSLIVIIGILKGIYVHWSIFFITSLAYIWNIYVLYKFYHRLLLSIDISKNELNVYVCYKQKSICYQKIILNFLITETIIHSNSNQYIPVDISLDGIRLRFFIGETDAILLLIFCTINQIDVFDDKTINKWIKKLLESRSFDSFTEATLRGRLSS